MSWEATQTLLNLFTKKQPGLREGKPPPQGGRSPSLPGSLRVCVLGGSVCQFCDNKKIQAPLWSNLNSSVNNTPGSGEVAFCLSCFPFK